MPLITIKPQHLKFDLGVSESEKPPVLHELKKKYKMFLLAPILTLFAFLTYSEGKIWEGGAKPLLNYNLRK